MKSIILVYLIFGLFIFRNAFSNKLNLDLNNTNSSIIDQEVVKKTTALKKLNIRANEKSGNLRDTTNSSNGNSGSSDRSYNSSTSGSNDNNYGSTNGNNESTYYGSTSGSNENTYYGSNSGSNDNTYGTNMESKERVYAPPEGEQQDTSTSDTPLLTVDNAESVEEKKAKVESDNSMMNVSKRLLLIVFLIIVGSYIGISLIVYSISYLYKNKTEDITAAFDKMREEKNKNKTDSANVDIKSNYQFYVESLKKKEEEDDIRSPIEPKTPVLKISDKDELRYSNNDKDLNFNDIWETTIFVGKEVINGEVDVKAYSPTIESAQKNRSPPPRQNNPLHNTSRQNDPPPPPRQNIPPPSPNNNNNRTNNINHNMNSRNPSHHNTTNDSINHNNENPSLNVIPPRQPKYSPKLDYEAERNNKIKNDSKSNMNTDNNIFKKVLQKKEMSYRKKSDSDSSITSTSNLLVKSRYSQNLSDDQGDYLNSPKQPSSWDLVNASPLSLNPKSPKMQSSMPIPPQMEMTSINNNNSMKNHQDRVHFNLKDDYYRSSPQTHPNPPMSSQYNAPHQKSSPVVTFNESSRRTSFDIQQRNTQELLPPIPPITEEFRPNTRQSFFDRQQRVQEASPSLSPSSTHNLSPHDRQSSYDKLNKLASSQPASRQQQQPLRVQTSPKSNESNHSYLDVQAPRQTSLGFKPSSPNKPSSPSNLHLNTFDTQQQLKQQQKVQPLKEKPIQNAILPRIQKPSYDRQQSPSAISSPKIQSPSSPLSSPSPPPPPPHQSLNPNQASHYSYHEKRSQRPNQAPIPTPTSPSSPSSSHHHANPFTPSSPYQRPPQQPPNKSSSQRSQQSMPLYQSPSQRPQQTPYKSSSSRTQPPPNKSSSQRSQQSMPLYQSPSQRPQQIPYKSSPSRTQPPVQPPYSSPSPRPQQPPPNKSSSQRSQQSMPQYQSPSQRPQQPPLKPSSQRSQQLPPPLKSSSQRSQQAPNAYSSPRHQSSFERQDRRPPSQFQIQPSHPQTPPPSRPSYLEMQAPRQASLDFQVKPSPNHGGSNGGIPSRLH